MKKKLLIALVAALSMMTLSGCALWDPCWYAPGYGHPGPPPPPPPHHHHAPHHGPGHGPH